MIGVPFWIFWIDVECSSRREVFLNSICEHQLKFGNAPKFRVGGGNAVADSRPVGSNIAAQIQRPLRIPHEELVAGAVWATLATSVVVFMWPIAVASIHIDDQIVDVVFDVQIVFETRIVGTIWIQTLHLHPGGELFLTAIVGVVHIACET